MQTLFLSGLITGNIKDAQFAICISSKVSYANTAYKMCPALQYLGFAAGLK